MYKREVYYIRGNKQEWRDIQRKCDYLIYSMCSDLEWDYGGLA